MGLNVNRSSEASGVVCDKRVLVRQKSKFYETLVSLAIMH